jgi:hypothetical protein
MPENDTFASKAPFLTKEATYTWADLFEVRMQEGTSARMTVRTNEEQEIEFDIEDAPDLVALMQHALDSRESRPR